MTNGFTYVEDNPTIESIVGQAMGYASVCWSDIDAAGIFDSTAASQAVTTAVHEIQNHLHSQLTALLDQEGVATEWNQAIEAAINAVAEKP